jgi:cytochrome b pre-mRNA-processing protein 3
MIFKLFARKSDEAAVERLYSRIMAAARRPELFLGRYAVADTLDGRFDLLVVHVLPVVRRLTSMPAPGPDLAQGLSDHMFLAFDRALREMGVGDLAVPKRMKKLGSDYNGRCQAYAAALEAGSEEELAGALARNVYGTGDSERARPLARYMLAVVSALESAELEAFRQGRLPIPDPDSVS